MCVCVCARVVCMTLNISALYGMVIGRGWKEQCGGLLFKGAEPQFCKMKNSADGL